MFILNMLGWYKALHTISNNLSYEGTRLVNRNVFKALMPGKLTKKSIRPTQLAFEYKKISLHPFLVDGTAKLLTMEVMTE